MLLWAANLGIDLCNKIYHGINLGMILSSVWDTLMLLNYLNEYCINQTQ